MSGTQAIGYGYQPGELGDAWPSVPLGTGRKALSLAIGMIHSCALLDTHDVKCWGDNQNGSLGQGDTNQRLERDDLGDALPPIALGTGRSVVAISAGDRYTCALLDHGDVKCWGRTRHGGMCWASSPTPARRSRCLGRRRCIRC